jgi:hypothetical protein
MRELSGSERRQLIDCEQVFQAWRSAQRENIARYTGSMSWKQVGAQRYLYRKKSDAWKCIGPENAETLLAFNSFQQGRVDMRARLASLDAEIVKQAKIVRAMDLGRVPLTTAKILRRLDRAGVLGHGINVAGTNALYAYERMAGVHFDAELATTLDIDLLFDARGSLDLVSSGLADTGLIGLLGKVDKTFQLSGPGSFRAVNDKGFMVDLIMPSARNPATRKPRQSIGDGADDLTAVEIAGLKWLENGPTVEVIVVDERGAPLIMVVPDPRVFVCHKLWVAARNDREPIKRRRDWSQAAAVCAILVSHLSLPGFDDPALSAVPQPLRDDAARLEATIRRNAATAVPSDDWQ